PRGLQDAPAIFHVAERSVFHSLSPTISGASLGSSRLFVETGFDKSARLRFGIAHAAKTEVIRPGVHFSLAASACHVARAVLVRAKKRPSTVHPFSHSRLI